MHWDNLRLGSHRASLLRFTRSGFVRHIVTLATGAALAQVIPLFVQPILTRLYTPHAFGVLSLYVALMLEKMLSFSRHNKMALLMLLDVLLLPLALWSAVILRLGGSWDPKLNPYLWIFVVPPFWVIPIFIHLGLYRAVVKYLDDKIVFTVFYGVTLAVLVLTAVITMTGMHPFPRSSIIIFWMFAMAYIGGSRFLLRGLVRRIDAVDAPREHVIIYGAGRAGVQLMLALQAGREYRPMAFVDDNAGLWKRTFRGIAVHVYGCAGRIGLGSKYRMTELYAEECVGPSALECCLGG